MLKIFFQRLYRRINRLLALRGNVVVGREFVIGIGGQMVAPDKISVGDNVSIGRNFFMACNGSIGNGVLISSYVGVVGRRDHDMSAIGVPISRSPWIYSPDARSRGVEDEICIQDDVWIGYGATLLSGVTVGRGSVIGAGSLVTKDVAPYDIVVGSPARPVGRRFSAEEIQEHEDILAKRFRDS